ncbi:MAG: DUF3179 domain-containing protein, partial [Actinomycetota bacterium]|nr:DUF3179 domain-containing protein [Actinomycetota bacterium]
PEAPGPAAAAAVPGGAARGSAREQVPSALRQGLKQAGLPAPLVDPSEVVSGGPPPDGIPPIDDPRFLAAGEVDWLAGDEPVVALQVGDRHRAYPVQIMIWHEIVNDELAGTPVAVTYCPLCNSALAFDRRLGERLLTLGTSGKLYRSDLVMYDRQTESLWSQIEGRAIGGHLAGEKLRRVPVQVVTWDAWRQAHPDGQVLSRETGVERDYGSNPYVGYDAPAAHPFLFRGDADPRLRPKERVLGLGDEGADGVGGVGGVGGSGEKDPVAVVLADLAEQRVAEVEVAGRPVTVWAVAGLRSALDTDTVAAGRKVAATGAFDPMLGNRRLTFTAAGTDTFTDRQTGSTWNLLGRAVAGPLAGQQLQPVGHLDTFWFAWAAFHPDTRVQRLDGTR